MFNLPGTGVLLLAGGYAGRIGARLKLSRRLGEAVRYLFASQPKIMGEVQGIVYRTLATQLRGPT